MRVSTSRLSPVTTITGAATFGALASLVTLLFPPALQPSFPILFYLKFDFAEVIDLLAFLVFGPVSGTLTATVHFVILSFSGGTGVFGASLKFFAVLTTYLGVYLATRLGKHTLAKTGLAMTLGGLVTRVTLMTVVNYAYILVIAQTVFGQNYLYFPQFVLSQVGINLTGVGLIIYVLELTAAFNAAHAIFTIVVSLVVVSTLLTRAPQLLESRAWIANYVGLSSKVVPPASVKESDGPA
jgi:riboflavin transporter FmnP